MTNYKWLSDQIRGMVKNTELLNPSEDAQAIFAGLVLIANGIAVLVALLENVAEKRNEKNP